MDKNESFVYNEVDYETPKQSAQSNQTWPMDKIRQSRFQKKMSSLLSPVTPKWNRNISNTRSLLLKCLRDAKSDPLPRKRIPVSCSDEGFLMDGVLVTSATSKKVSDSPCSSLSRSSIFRSQHKKNAEFNCPRSESGSNEETIRSHEQSSDGEGKMLVATPKATNPSKLQATAEPFILTPREASPLPSQQLSYDHCNPQFPWAPYPYFQRPRLPIYLYRRPLPFPLLPHGPYPYQLHSQQDFPILSGNRTPTRRNNTNNSSTTPSPSQPNTTTNQPPVHSPISTTPTEDLRTSTPTTTHAPSPSVDRRNTETQIQDLSESPSNRLQKVMQNPDLASPSVGLQTVMQNPDLASPTVGLQTVMQNPDLASHCVRSRTIMTNREWLPSDDGLPTYTEAQLDDMLSDNKFLPVDIFGYQYTKRMPALEVDYSPFYRNM